MMPRYMLVTFLLGLMGLVVSFDPRALRYAKSTASCKATLRSPAPEKTVDIFIRYVDVNPEEKSTILMVHGWPSVWSTWARQIEEFGKDYHLLVPNLRGFGDSTHPGDVEASGTLGDMVQDLVCVLQSAGVSKAICMGHDWGSSVCYEAARARPDVFIGVVGAVVPYLSSAGPFLPVKDVVPLLPRLAYQVFFEQNIETAAAELDADIKRTMRSTLRTFQSPPPTDFLTSNSTFMGAWNGTETLPVPFFSSEEEDYYVEEIGKQGFKHTLQFYTSENRHLSWQLAHEQGNHTIPQPVLAIYPTKDRVADWVLLQKVVKSADFIPDLTVRLLETAHWPHLEKYQEFNFITRSWLEERFSPQRLHDEL